MEATRKLIRPPFDAAKGKPPEKRPPAPSDDKAKSAPAEHTNAENFYYMKQMQSKTPMVIVLKDGETLNGVIEWYDKCCIKVNRDEGPNLLLFKSNIKYMHKA